MKQQDKIFWQKLILYMNEAETYLIFTGQKWKILIKKQKEDSKESSFFAPENKKPRKNLPRHDKIHWQMNRGVIKWWSILWEYAYFYHYSFGIFILPQFMAAVKNLKKKN